jgi:branched-chain amino acid transport system permease protein
MTGAVLTRARRELAFVGPVGRTSVTTVVLAALLAYGVAEGAYVQSQLGLLCGLAVAALGYNVALGLCGQFAFCQGAFMAIGCYVCAVVEPAIGAFAAAVVAVLMAGIVATVVGLLVLRTREIYLAVVTLAFASALGVLIEHFPPTNGDNGIQVSVAGQNVWLLGIVVLWLAMLGYDRFRTSQLGRMAVLVSSDDDTALTSGVRVKGLRVGAITLSGLFGGLGGVIWGGSLGFVTPDSFSVDLTLLLLTIIVIAGSRSSWLTVLVTALYVVSQQYLTVASQWSDVIYGGLLVVAVFLRATLGERRSPGRTRTGAAGAGTDARPVATAGAGS